MDTLTVWIDALANAYPEEDMELMSEYLNYHRLGFSQTFITMILDKVRKELRKKAGLKTCACTCHEE